MFISVGYLVIAAYQWYRDRLRHSMIHRYISSSLRVGSVIVQKVGTQNQRDVKQSLSSSKLVERIDDLVVRETYNDQCISVSQAVPKIKVNLEKWTAYYHDISDTQLTADDQEVTVLLESIRPTDIESFAEEQVHVSQAKSFHILDHGHPLAWNTGPPFGIVMQCSGPDFLALCLSFMDNSIIMEEDLQVNRITSIQTIGKAASLVNIDMKEIQTMEDASSQWSNESLADTASLANQDALETSSQDWEGVDAENGLDMDSSNREDLDAAMEESGSGETMFDPKDLNVVPLSADKSAKPPNIVVYCGKKDASRKFQNVKQVLQQCINNDCYVIYCLKHDEVHSVPWAENTALLVLTEENLYDKCDDVVCRYFERGGGLISFGSNVDANFVPRRELHKGTGIRSVSYGVYKEVPLLCGRHSYMIDTTRSDVAVKGLATDDKEQTVVVEVTQNVTEQTPGRAILSQVLLDQDPTDVALTQDSFNLLKKSNPTRFEILSLMLTAMGITCEHVTQPDLSPCFMLANDQVNKVRLLNGIAQRLKGGFLKSASVTLQFLPRLVPDVKVTSTVLPVITDKMEEFKFFNIDEYWENLTTARLGNLVLYADVVPSTMPLLDGLQFSEPKTVGLIAIAGRQTQGQGRGGNSWLSPEGCAMFSIHVRIEADNPLGQAVSYLQHITSLAVVESVRTLPGYQDIDLRLKWPNDIYYSDKMKLGGVVARSSFVNGACDAIIGCGFNVSNANPTICINDVISSYNKEHNTSLPLLSKEKLMARTVSIMENLISEFEKNGRTEFCKKYYQRWMHGDHKVQLDTEGDEVFTVQGVDEHGYLEVVSDDGKLISVQPDGNSYDMMRNLIHMKTR
ncbi:biotin--protein ligase-like isoform X2 [Ostrea edulis]|uniref:biotin--protein ligase-like isoform X2 n=1 Tax=Ostrea edulis TaxID=37623 RepID=UPI0024AF9979|nr:biotin--protein ligase-like isoform X2 [Ostrea edulis]